MNDPEEIIKSTDEYDLVKYKDSEIEYDEDGGITVIMYFRIDAE